MLRVLLSGSIDTASTKGLTIYLLGYVGTISIALMVARAIPAHLTASITNDFVRSFLRIGLPVFVFATIYHWMFPSALAFSEHVVDNLVLALLMSWVSRLPEQSSQ